MNPLNENSRGLLKILSKLKIKIANYQLSYVNTKHEIN